MNEAPWLWFAMRASGLVAIALLTIAVVLGILGPRLPPTARLTAITLHRAVSVAGAALIAGHVVLAIKDEWITLDWPAALVPGVAGWERWGIAVGAVSLDLLLALLMTTATRLAWPGLWRRTHLVAYPIWALSVGHGLLVGTDGGAMQVLALASAGVVLLAIAVRLVVRPRGVEPESTPTAEAAIGGPR